MSAMNAIGAINAMNAVGAMNAIGAMNMRAFALKPFGTLEKGRP